MRKTISYCIQGNIKKSNLNKKIFIFFFHIKEIHGWDSSPMIYTSNFLHSIPNVTLILVLDDCMNNSHHISLHSTQQDRKRGKKKKIWDFTRVIETLRLYLPSQHLITLYIQLQERLKFIATPLCETDQIGIFITRNKRKSCIGINEQLCNICQFFTVVHITVF